MLKTTMRALQILVAFIGSDFKEAVGGDPNSKKVTEVRVYSDLKHTGYN